MVRVKRVLPVKGVHLHLNPVGGIAGDMVCAALLDAFPEHLDGLRATIATLAPPDGWAVTVEEVHAEIDARF
jgi:uncharacterized protein (DUF111 family)